MNGRGQDFEEFMKEQGLYEEAMELATKKIIAAQLNQEKELQKPSKTTVAMNNAIRKRISVALA